MKYRKADEAFHFAFLMLLGIGLAMFMYAWMNEELPGPVMDLISWELHATRHPLVRK